MRRAVVIDLTEEERATLLKWSKGRSVAARLVLRAKIILHAAAGMLSKEIAVQLEIPPKTVCKWRTRFAQQRLAGIEKDAPRGGRKPSVRSQLEAEIIRKTTQEKPRKGKVWSTRKMAEAVGTSQATVNRVWRDNNLKPHLTKTFKVSNDPKFAEKLVDIVGLYLNPPENAVVFSTDEKTQIQALDRTQKSLPMFPGRLKTLTHDYKRNGTTTLFAAIEMAHGKIIAQCQPRHRHQEWLKFLKQIEASVEKGLDIHIIADNYATHKHAKVQAWLAKHPRVHMHFTPTSSSWLNLIERRFAEITREAIRPDTFRSVDELIAAIMKYVEECNADPKPLTWTKSAEAILEKVARAKAALNNSPSA